MRRVVRSAVVMLFVLAAPSTAQVSINFDGTGAPCTFGETTPLTNLYAGSGVTFGGNGSILNECSTFSVNARSGTDFLAFNSLNLPVTETFQFSSPVSYFSIWVGATSSLNWSVFFANGAIGFAGATNPSTWTQISYTAPSSSQYFDRVTVTGSQTMVLDDLEFTPESDVVPEPATMTLLATGLAALGAHRRKRRTS